MQTFDTRHNNLKDGLEITRLRTDEVTAAHQLSGNLHAVEQAPTVAQSSPEKMEQLAPVYNIADYQQTNPVEPQIAPQVAPVVEITPTQNDLDLEAIRAKVAREAA